MPARKKKPDRRSRGQSPSSFRLSAVKESSDDAKRPGGAANAPGPAKEDEAPMQFERIETAERSLSELYSEFLAAKRAVGLQ